MHRLRWDADLEKRADGAAGQEDDDGRLDGLRTLDFHRLDGDDEGTRRLDVEDLNLLYARFGQTPTDPAFDPVFDRAGDDLENLK